MISLQITPVCKQEVPISETVTYRQSWCGGRLTTQLDQLDAVYLVWSCDGHAGDFRVQTGDLTATASPSKIFRSGSGNACAGAVRTSALPEKSGEDERRRP